MTPDRWTRLAWLALVLVHAPPTLPLFAPAMLERLYGVRPAGDLALLLTHRAALFAAVALLAVWAAFDADVRRAACACVALSVGSFLLLYVAAGAPEGPLRRVAVVDALALAPLAWVSMAAWRS